uniref:Uncharacterized protein n=1 Tax=Branchiostoma floridae TaxID=7739 RepID=C3ZJQ7_BRAFL|eukprot:XP_002591181.1 hypothetical protein BRAFLDRAFT_105383 [Branchiostoma floridae]
MVRLTMENTSWTTPRNLFLFLVLSSSFINNACCRPTLDVDFFLPRNDNERQVRATRQAVTEPAPVNFNPNERQSTASADLSQADKVTPRTGAPYITAFQEGNKGTFDFSEELVSTLSGSTPQTNADATKYSMTEPPATIPNFSFSSNESQRKVAASAGLSQTAEVISHKRSTPATTVTTPSEGAADETSTEP